MPEPWTDEELRACVVSYKAMLSKEMGAERYEKSAVRRHLMQGPLSSRSAQSIEYRMRNISSILAEQNRRYVSGYLPASHTGSDIRRRIEALLAEVEGAQSVSTEDLSASVPPMVFFNVGWMKRYQGMAEDDRTLGRHGYLREHTHGFESFNFRPEGGRVFGYQPRRDRMWLPRLGVSPRAETAEHVLVVWLATHPVALNVLVVGWYIDATIYRTPIVRIPAEGQGAGLNEIPYTAEALAENATLLPEVNRTFRAPTHHSMEGGLGQSPVWYGANDDFRRRVWTYIQGITRNIKSSEAQRRRGGGRPRNPDPEHRRKVEKAAVDHAIAHFTSEVGGTYAVKSVEGDACGWDLEAARGDETLLIEVKGLSGNGGVCELTPNEYAKSQHKDHSANYVIYIVSDCLSEAPVANIFRCTPNGLWEAADGRRLSVVPVVGARLTIVDHVPSNG